MKSNKICLHNLYLLLKFLFSLFILLWSFKNSTCKWLWSKKLKKCLKISSDPTWLQIIKKPDAFTKKYKKSLTFCTIYIFRFLCNCNTVTINSLIEVCQFRQVLEIFTDILIAISIDLEIGQHHYNAIFERFDIQNVFYFPLYIPLINIDKLVYYVS